MADVFRSLRSAVLEWGHHARLALGIRRPRDFERLETAIVLLLDDDQSHNRIREIQIDILKRHGANDGLAAPPHITLKLGFPTSDLRALSTYIEEIATTHGPVDVSLRNFGSFANDKYIFIGVEANTRIERLRQKILKDLHGRFGVHAYPIERDGFHLHVTLAYGLSANDFTSEYKNLSEQAFSIRSTIRKIAILCWINNQWVVYSQADLRH